jgi:DNA-directed RNA polymerase subunit RPC12/RpoP
MKDKEYEKDPNFCYWSEKCDESFWSTECGHNFQFTEGSIKTNNFVYCPYCGKQIEED